jgi:hypothetical protein
VLWIASDRSIGVADVPGEAPAGIDTTVPHSARIWNHLQGGKDNFAIDREAAAKITEVFPGMADIVRQSRSMLTRAVRFLAGEAGIRQFLDIGAGLPAADNTHEVAQRVSPDARVVYADKDPLVLVHARALLTGTPEGATAYTEADVRDPDTILRKAARTLDLSRPTALMLMGVMGLIADHEEALGIVRRLLAALPPGSYLALYDGSDADPVYVQAISGYNRASGANPYTPRSVPQISTFFEGLELLEPGVVPVPRWRPAGPSEPPEVACAGGVARKP